MINFDYYSIAQIKIKQVKICCALRLIVTTEMGKILVHFTDFQVIKTSMQSGKICQGKLIIFFLLYCR